MKMSIYQISDYKNMCKKGEKMNREEFLSACGECEVGYRAQLLDFYRNYADIVDKIYDKYALLDGEDQNKMLVKRLKSWLEQRAYSGIVSTINTLDENSEQKVLGFIHLYDYIKSVYLIATRDLRISGCNFFYLKIKGLCDFLRKRF